MIKYRILSFATVFVLTVICISCKSQKSDKQSDTVLSDTIEQVNQEKENFQVMPNEEVSFQLLEGRWQLYNAIQDNFNIDISFDYEGDINITKVCNAPNIEGVEILDFEPIISYQGKYEIQAGGNIIYSIKDINKDMEEIRGTILARQAGNYCEMIFEDGLEGVAVPGKVYKMFSTTELYRVDLPKKPNVADIFEQALPFVFQPVIRDAAMLLIDNKHPYSDSEATKMIDTSAGYLFYQGGGAPASALEACIWRCKDGTTLLAINVKGESPDVQPTEFFTLFRYYPEVKSLMRLDGMSEKIFHFNNKYPQSISLPRKGKNITVCMLNYMYECESTEIIEWNEATGNFIIE
ncbi:MAG: hypothetical protein ACI3ZZ_06975 [Candidatus Aphodosoma sp.]